MSSSGDSIARKLTLSSYFSNRRKARLNSPRTERKSMTTIKRSTTVKRSSNKSSGGGGTKPKFTKADPVAFNKLPDKVRKASKKKIAAFRAAGHGVYEDNSVNTQGMGFKRFVTGSKGLPK